MLPLLSINNLHTSFIQPSRTIDAVRDLNLSIEKGSVQALVGESGSGKSMTALSILRLVPPPGIISSGKILFEDRNLLDLSDEEMRLVRGRRISMVFQEPMTSLNPVLRISDQLSEPLMLHNGLTAADALERGAALLEEVGIPSAGDRMRDYPHQLSGGMRQRVMIAMALACNPTLLIADEPTTALDVTIQAQILELLDKLRKSAGLAMLLITHDLGIVSDRSDHTSVMYAGQIVESAPTKALLSSPSHPYTQALLASLPQYSEPGKPLKAMPGQLTGMSTVSPGCAFAGRCPIASDNCFQEDQHLAEITPEHHVRCWKCL